MPTLEIVRNEKCPHERLHYNLDEKRAHCRDCRKEVALWQLVEQMLADEDEGRCDAPPPPVCPCPMVLEMIRKQQVKERRVTAS